MDNAINLCTNTDRTKTTLFPTDPPKYGTIVISVSTTLNKAPKKCLGSILTPC